MKGEAHHILSISWQLAEQGRKAGCWLLVGTELKG